MKKANFMVDNLGWIILILVTAVITINIVAKFMMKADSAFDPAVCRASVLANSKLNTALSNEWQVKCTTRYHYFGKESYIEESGDKKVETPYKRDLAYEACIKKNKDNEEAAEQCVIGVINKVIADRHKECWEQFGRGELSLFNRLDTKRQCVICSVYDFSEDLKENFDDRYVSEIVEEESNLDYYMKTTIPYGYKLTIAEIVKDPLDIYDEPYYDYTFQEPYASVFVANHEDYVQTVLTKAIDDVQSVMKNFNWIEETDGIESASFLNTNDFKPEPLIVSECDVLVEQ